MYFYKTILLNNKTERYEQRGDIKKKEEVIFPLFLISLVTLLFSELHKTFPKAC